MKTYQGLPVGKHRLVHHPDTPPEAVGSVEVEVVMTDGDDILLRFRVEGGGLSLPEARTAQRADDLWKSTCFELFLKSIGSAAYFEFNFSPSTEWAAYAFGGYRSGMRDLALTVAPFIDIDPEPEPEGRAFSFALDADVDLSGIPPVALCMGLSAVIEETSGRKSFWALAHAPGPPDFHHEACFALELPAAG